jgi:hypothetical protein
VTYDAAHRMEHGRTHLFSVAEQKRIEALRRFTNTLDGLNQIVANRPTVADYELLSPNEQDLVRLRARKTPLGEVLALLEYLEGLNKPQRPPIDIYHVRMDD